MLLPTIFCRALKSKPSLRSMSYSAYFQPLSPGFFPRTRPRPSSLGLTSFSTRRAGIQCHLINEAGSMPRRGKRSNPLRANNDGAVYHISSSYRRHPLGAGPRTSPRAYCRRPRWLTDTSLRLLRSPATTTSRSSSSQPRPHYTEAPRGQWQDRIFTLEGGSGIRGPDRSGLGYRLQCPARDGRLLQPGRVTPLLLSGSISGPWPSGSSLVSTLGTREWRPSQTRCNAFILTSIKCCHSRLQPSA